MKLAVRRKSKSDSDSDGTRNKPCGSDDVAHLHRVRLGVDGPAEARRPYLHKHTVSIRRMLTRKEAFSFSSIYSEDDAFSWVRRVSAIRANDAQHTLAVEHRHAHKTKNRGAHIRLLHGGGKVRSKRRLL